MLMALACAWLLLLQGAPAPKPKKGSKAEPPKLDDAASWPSIGGAPVPAAAAASEAESEPEEEEPVAEEAPVEEGEVTQERSAASAAVAAAAVAAAVAAAEDEGEAPTPAANGGLVSVKLSVAADGSVLLTLAA